MTNYSSSFLNSAEVKRLIDSNKATLLDIRQLDVYMKETIKGAYSSPITELKSQELTERDSKHIIFFCQSGRTTSENASSLNGLSNNEVYFLTGGLNQWKADGFATVKPNLSSMPDELTRFTSLHFELIEQTFEYLERITDLSVYANVPVDSDVNFLGTRVNKITIGGLIRHLIIAEAHWFEQLKVLPDGSTVPFPKNSSFLVGVKDGENLINAYKKAMHKAKAEFLETLTSDDLQKRVEFAGRKYTVIGMLWTIYSHHAFHLGQVDLLMRQQNIEPPEYMEFPNSVAVIA